MPVSQANQLKVQRAQLVEQARTIDDRAWRESRELTKDEERDFERLMGEAEKLDPQIRLEEEREAGRRPARRQVQVGGAERAGDAVLLERRHQVADHFGTSHLERDEFGGGGVRPFSLGRAVRGMVTGDWGDADVERRVLSVGTNSAGGFLTPEPIANYVIDRIRNQARVIEAGARTVPMDSDTLAIPRLASGVTPAWRNENAAVAESDAVFERVTLTARSLAVMTRLSYELFEDMTPQGADIIETELVKALAIELDRVALRGTGTPPEPQGVKNQTGVATITNGANGTAMAWSMLVQNVATVQAAGFDPNASILAPRATKSLALLADTTGQPLQPPPYLDGHELLVTAQLPINITTGSSTDTSEIYTGQWDQLLIGFRPIVRIDVQRTDGPAGMIGVKVSQERYIENMQVVLLCYLRADIALLHGQAFAVNTGVRP